MKRSGPLRRRRPLTANARLQRSPAPRRAAPVAPRSQRRLAEAEARAAACAEALARHHGRCALWSSLRPAGCTPGTALDYHEVIRRSQWPGAHLDARLILPLCRRHHDLDVRLPTAEAAGIRAPRWAADRLGLDAVLAELALQRAAYRSGRARTPAWRQP